MKKFYKWIAGIIIVMVFAFLIHSYFIVSGSEIEGMPKISATSSIVIKKNYHLKEEEQEHVLNARQRVMVRDLILKSKFTRDLSSVVYFDDEDRYSIIINDDKEQVFLTIDCIGNEYISVANQFDGKHLKINNPDWKAKLEEIIAMPKT